MRLEGVGPGELGGTSQFSFFFFFLLETSFPRFNFSWSGFSVLSSCVLVVDTHDAHRRMTNQIIFDNLAKSNDFRIMELLWAPIVLSSMEVVVFCTRAFTSAPMVL